MLMVPPQPPKLCDVYAFPQTACRWGRLHPVSKWFPLCIPTCLPSCLPTGNLSRHDFSLISSPLVSLLAFCAFWGLTRARYQRYAVASCEMKISDNSPNHRAYAYKKLSLERTCFQNLKVKKHQNKSKKGQSQKSKSKNIKSRKIRTSKNGKTMQKNQKINSQQKVLKQSKKTLYR